MRITGKIKQNIPYALMVGALLFLSGTPAHANVTASPATVSFGNQAVGVPSAPITVTVTNQGRGKIKMGLPSVSPAQFSYIGPTQLMTLSPGESFTGSLEFTPGAAQTYNGTLVFTSQNGANITVPVSGAGIQVQAPTITTQPSSKSIVAGQTATFSVAATGATPMTYKWIKNSAEISGATSSSYTTPPESTADNNAKFAVMASNSMGSTTSSPALLTVNPAPVAPAITTQPVSTSITTGQTATFLVAATGTAPLSYQWSLNGAAISGANSSSYTTPTETNAGITAQFTVAVTNSAGTATSNAAVLTVNPAPVVPTVSSVSPNNGPTAGGTAVTITGTNFAAGAAVTFGSAAATNVVVVSGTQITATAPAGSAGAVTVTVTVNGQSGSLANGFTHTSTVSTCAQNLAIGSFTLCGEAYNDVSTAANVQVNYSPSPGNGIIAWATWCFTASCTTSISGVTATIGDNINATESCFVASPHSPLFTNSNGGGQGSGDFQEHYVWYCPAVPSGVTSFTMTPSNPNLSYVQMNITEWKAGSLAASCSPISACFENVDNFGQAGNSTGGTTATITTNGPTVNANDLIFSVIQEPCCSVTDSPGTGYTGITVAPNVTPSMVSEAKAVTATGTQTATATWTGGTTPWLGVIVPLIGAGGAGATPVAPTITTQPVSKTITAGQTATFSVAATGTAPMAYQWMKNTVAISGATSSSYTTPAETTSDNNAQFAVTVTNSAGNAASNPATLTVNAGTLVLNGSSSALSFGNVTIPNTGTQTVTLTNAGTSSVSISGVSLTGPGFGASGVPSGLTLSPGQTATLTVTFSPSATGSVTGSVAVASNASNSPDKITLSGTGVAAVTHSAALSWVASTSVVTGYNAYSSTTSGGPYTKLTSTPTAGTSYNDSTVQAGQTYYYVVTAVDSSGMESAYSAQVSATIP